MSKFKIANFKSSGIAERYNMSDFFDRKSSADFTVAFPISAQNESGYVNDPRDAGGETYRGIARNYNPGWAGWPLIDAYKASNGVPKTGFTNPDWDQMAATFYKTNFWDKVLLDQVADQDNANQIYDHTLSGLPRSIAMIKSVLNNVFGYSLPVTGTMDSATLSALNEVDQQKFFDNYKQARSDFFTYSAAKLAPTDSIYFPLFKQYNPNPSPGNQVYLNGWLKRVNRYAKTTIGKAYEDVKVEAEQNPIIAEMIVGTITAGLVFSIYFLIHNRNKT